MLSRRQALANSTPILVGIATIGCLEGDERGERIELCRLDVFNYDGSPHTISVQVVDGDEELYSRTDTVEGGSESRPDGFAVPTTEIPDEPGSYRVRARLDEEDWEELELSEVVDEHASVKVVVSTQSEFPYLEFWYSGSPCRNSNSL